MLIILGTLDFYTINEKNMLKVIGLIALLIIVFLVVLFLYFLIKGSGPAFKFQFNVKLEATGSVEQALRSTIEDFAKRSELAGLTPSDIDFLVDYFKEKPDPAVLGHLISICEKHKDVSILRNVIYLDNFMHSLYSER